MKTGLLIFTSIATVIVSIVYVNLPEEKRKKVNE